MQHHDDTQLAEKAWRSSPSAAFGNATGSKPQNRARKRGCKEFRCSLCGKAYSRAEHLYRHQLNHNPKQIYQCNMRNCGRIFVREDLLSRHKERHSNSDKEYQWKLEQSLREEPRRASSTPAPLSPSPAITTRPTVPLRTFHVLGEDLQSGAAPPFSVPDIPEKSCDFEPQVPGATTTPETTSALTDHDIAFGYETEGEQAMADRDFRNQDLIAPDLYSTLGLWQDEFDMSINVPELGGHGYNRSPFAMSDDFIHFLFDSNIRESPPSSQPSNLQPSTFADSSTEIHGGSQTANHTEESASSSREILKENYTVSTKQTDCSISLSESKYQEIYELIESKFTEDNRNITAGAPSRFRGDPRQSINVLTRSMMQKFIDNFWRNFHPQLPILHKPTFSPDTTPDLLLVAIIMIGTFCSDKGGNPDVTQASMEVGNALARHLRWEIFRDAHFHPAGLWVFQTLLLLEVYEKLFSTRHLHERAHIHHATAITLLRRDIALTERSILESPSRYQDNFAQSRSGVDSPRNDSWEMWITREATRRVAFAAFMIDVTHASMFGHSMIMAAHEIRCFLPCDDALWCATSAAEVGRIKSAFQDNGIKPTSFLEGLQKMLKGEEVSTNEFGRGILMCGLLSVSWYMNQRDLQMQSLGVGKEAPSRGKRWEKSITRAFEIWKQSCERAASSTAYRALGNGLDSDLVLESRLALYHLAQISRYADLNECQILAGAKLVQGRTISKLDFEGARRRAKAVWAPSSDARTAVFYAIRYLCSVLMPKGANGKAYSAAHEFVPDYTARKSIVPSRCWVLYSAGLVVWSYSFVMDGPTNAPSSSSNTLEDHITDMNAFLLRINKIESPDEIIHHRLNACGGMLKILRYMFRQADWELLQEAADLLTTCIKLIRNSGS